MFFNGLPTLHDGGKQTRQPHILRCKKPHGAVPVRSKSLMLNSLANLTDDVDLSENLPLNENKFAFKFQNDGYLVLTLRYGELDFFNQSDW